jgi:hypothetical protein
LETELPIAHEKLLRIVIIVDELADLMMSVRYRRIHYPPGAKSVPQGFT